MKRTNEKTVPDKSCETNKQKKCLNKFTARALTVNGDAYNSISHDMRRSDLIGPYHWLIPKNA